MQKEIDEKKKILLEGLGFEQTKTNMFKKVLDNGDAAFWDFRKTEKGNFYVSLKDGDFMKDEDAKQLSEYTDFRKPNSVQKTKPTLNKPVYVPTNVPSESVVLRGNEDAIANVVKRRRLDMIAKVAKDKLGEGILYHDLGDKIGFEPSAELIDMIASDMGDIETTVVEHGTHRHINPETADEFNTYYAIVKAIDKATGTTGYGSAEQVIDYDEMKKNGRCFSLTLAIRKAERNAKERLIPVPRKALVELIKTLIMENKK